MKNTEEFAEELQPMIDELSLDGIYFMIALLLKELRKRGSKE